MGELGKSYRDFYSRNKSVNNYRARSAYKLLNIIEKHDILKNVRYVIDLCAAPGSWSQVLSEALSHDPESSIVAVDLQDIRPINNVTIIKGDITKKSTLTYIEETLFINNSVDLILCDGAPDLTGLGFIDGNLQMSLLKSTLLVSCWYLKLGGTIVCKLFKTDYHNECCLLVSLFFDKVYFVKPDASRDTSNEYFIVAKGFKPPRSFININCSLEVFDMKIKQIFY